MTHRNVGILNAGWGICGFTSSLYAMYENNVSDRKKLAESAGEPTRMLAEIKTFLRMLQASGDIGTLGSITEFTRSFGGTFSNFSVDGYITMIDNACRTGTADPKDEKFGIAMPPAAVVKYLKDVCGRSSARVTTLNSGASQHVVGVKDVTEKKVLYGGLCHYLYELNDKYYSWGEPPFTSVTEADKDFEICLKIAL